MNALETPDHELIPLEAYETEFPPTILAKSIRDAVLGHSSAAQDKRPFQFVQACAMQVKQPSWLVDRYFETDATIMLYGASAVGKSFIGLDVACCVATGSQFHGHATKKGPVFVIVGEGHQGLARRRRAWEKQNGISLDGAPLYFSTGPADLGNAKDAERVAEAVRQLEAETGMTPALIIIDTLARNFRGEENSATDVGRFVQLVDEFLRREWKATVLIIHHSGKNSEQGARGSSALLAAVDAAYLAKRAPEDDVISLIPRKMKDAEEPPPLNFKLVSVDMVDDCGNAIVGAALKLTSDLPTEKAEPSGLGQNQKKALIALREIYERMALNVAKDGRGDQVIHVLYTEWQERCKQMGIPRNRFQEVYEALLSRKLIRSQGPHVYLSDMRESLGESEIRTGKEDGPVPVATPYAGSKFSGDL